MQTSAINQSCDYCQKQAQLSKCANCQSSQYCSRQCQVADWKEHSEICKYIQNFKQNSNSQIIDVNAFKQEFYYLKSIENFTFLYIYNEYNDFCHYQSFIQYGNKQLQVQKQQIIQQKGFDKQFCVSCCYNGWFLFSTDNIFIPKLHQKRTLLNLNDFDVIKLIQIIRENKNTNNKCIKYSGLAKRIKQIFKEGQIFVSINKNFKLSNQKNNSFQGNSWINNNFVDLLTDLSKDEYKFKSNNGQFQCYSIEIYKNNEQIAADIGYRIGSIYASMSGYSDRKYQSMGIVQLIIQGIILKEMGFQYWDFGMMMEYKQSIGAQLKNREETLEIYKNCRNTQIQLLNYLKGADQIDITQIPSFVLLFQHIQSYQIIKSNPKQSPEYHQRKVLEKTILVSKWNLNEVQLWIRNKFRNIDFNIFTNPNQLEDINFIKNNVKFKKNQKKINWAILRLQKQQVKLQLN